MSNDERKTRIVAAYDQKIGDQDVKADEEVDVAPEVASRLTNDGMARLAPVETPTPEPPFEGNAGGQKPRGSSVLATTTPPNGG